MVAFAGSLLIGYHGMQPTFDSQRRHHPVVLTAFTLHWMLTLQSSGVALPPSDALSGFPHVLNKIAAAWGDVRAMAGLMEGDLLIDNRGDRTGFPPGVLSEIYGLYLEHQSLYGAPRADVLHTRMRSKRLDAYAVSTPYGGE